MTDNKRFKVYSDSYNSDIVDEYTYKNYNQSEDFDDICDLLNSLNDEKEQYKAFIKQLTNNCGEIVLLNGCAYKIDKIIGDDG